MIPFPTPFHDSQPAETPVAIVRLVAREDMLWDRPIFKAPPLKVNPPLADLEELVRAVRRPEALGS